ncbi:MAG: 30S ribosomal protein S13 [Candidatus Pacebacteria bacterium]|nr:30S ribosomal protein S13 [Candidatus Paceibacterota bacterium]
MRLFGITLPENKTIDYALTSLFGVGLSRSRSILKQVSVEPLTKTKDITDEQESKIRTLVEEMTLEGNLKRQISQDIKRLKDIQSYRGSRHAKSLPARGQRTKTNSRTVRGNKRVTMGSGRKTADKK